jgi:hypothetical protein
MTRCPWRTVMTMCVGSETRSTASEMHAKFMHRRVREVRRMMNGRCYRRCRRRVTNHHRKNWRLPAKSLESTGPSTFADLNDESSISLAFIVALAIALQSHPLTVSIAWHGEGNKRSLQMVPVTSVQTMKPSFQLKKVTIPRQHGHV